MAHVDLDDLAKAQTDVEPKTFGFAGKTWSLPGVVPLACVFALRRNDLERFLRELLGDEPEGASQYDEFMAAKPDGRHMKAVIDAIELLYGVDAGESEASATPSNGTGHRSRQTSSATTS